MSSPELKSSSAVLSSTSPLRILGLMVVASLISAALVLGMLELAKVPAPAPVEAPKVEEAEVEAAPVAEAPGSLQEPVDAAPAPETLPVAEEPALEPASAK